MGISKEDFDQSTISGIASLSPELLKAALELWGQAGEVHYIPLRGTSMLPLLRDSDQVLVTHSVNMVHSGDIVLFQRSDGLVAHRVLRVFIRGDRRMLRTKGDHALGLDPEMSEGDLVGRVLVVRRDNRIMNIDTPAWRITGRVIAGVMLVQAWLYHKAGQAEGKPPGRISILFSRGVLWLGAVLINACQVVLGHWQREGETIAG